MKTKTLIRKDLCTLMFIVALFKIAKTQKQPTCALIDKWTQKMWGVYIYTHTVECYSAKKRIKSRHLQQYGWTYRVLWAALLALW